MSLMHANYFLRQCTLNMVSQCINLVFFLLLQMHFDFSFHVKVLNSPEQ